MATLFVSDTGCTVYLAGEFLCECGSIDDAVSRLWELGIGEYQVVSN